MVLRFADLPQRLAQATAKLIVQRPGNAVVAHKAVSFQQTLEQAKQRETAGRG